MTRFVAPAQQQSLPAPSSFPTFSVIIAAYQAAAVVSDAVESALSQTHLPLEVVVCDDGSTDDIHSALQPYRERIKLLTQENQGEAAAKNAAARAASGDFVAILDADDVFLPTWLEAIAELARARPDLAILTADAYLELDGQVVRRCYTDQLRFETDDQRRGILERNFIFGLAAVRRELLLAAGGFDESIRFATDWDCWIRLVLDGARAGLVAEPLARYRLHAGSLSSQRSRLIGGRIEVLKNAARRNDLTAVERDTLTRSLELNRRAFARAAARDALLDDAAGARRRALALALDSGLGVRTRLKALAAVALPRLARKWIARGPSETTGGVKVPTPELERRRK